MQLGDILDDLALDVVTSSVEVERVEIDSRSCSDRTLFFAMPGTTSHGVQFVDEAVARGAVAVVSDRAVPTSVPLVVVPTTQIVPLVAHAASVIVGSPQTKVKLVAVTGTNGKTSVTTMVSELARALGWNGASIGTLTGPRTTPASPELYRTLATLVGLFDPVIAKCVVSMEVSSHALVQRRIEGLHYCVGAFTNLGHDHLDYHGTQEQYFAAKASLFCSERIRRAVIWTDDSFGRRLAETTSVPVTRVSREDVSEISTTLEGSTYFWRGHLVNSSLVGGFNVDNSIMAMTILSALGEESARIAAAMAEVNSVPGRFEVIRGSGVTAVVDYAHTPEGLDRLLADVRALRPRGRVITVFGAGGDRDRAKRPEMGRVAVAGSDVAVVTSDNPRSEKPGAIIDETLAGLVGLDTVVREEDRRRAITRAFELATDGYVVVVAGKGHETVQILNGVEVPFDDRAVVRELLK